MAHKKILLTGSGGFIGKNLLEGLTGKYELLAPTHSELDLTNAASVGNFLKEHSPNIVIHAASIGVSKQKEGTAAANIKMFLNIARCSKYFGKMLQIGSGAEYGKSRPIIRIKESDFGKYVPKDEYGFSKYTCSKYIETADNITCLRLFGCYGKYEDYGTRFISNAICRCLFDLPISIENRNVVFSYLYVGDFVRVVEHFASHPASRKFYNVTPSETADLVSIASLVDEISGKSLPINVKNSGLGNEYTADNSLLRSELPNFKFTSLKEGIKELHAWYKKNKNSIDPKKLV